MAIPSVYNEGVYNAGIYNLFSAPGDVALKLDGKGQYLARTDNLGDATFDEAYNTGTYNEGIYGFPAINLGISNAWTLGFWAKPLDYKEHTTIFSVGDASGKNEIDVFVTPIYAERDVFGTSPSEMRVLIKDNNGTTIKHFSWPDWFQIDTWTHTTIQWDGIDLIALKDNVPVSTGISFVNIEGNMSDTVRRVYYGAPVTIGAATFSGVLGHFGMWNSLVDAGEFGTVVSGGFSADLAVSSGTYSSHATLQHYWRPGDDPLNIGKDYTVSGTALDLTKEHDVDCLGNTVVDEPA